jgi:hypothetical protein
VRGRVRHGEYTGPKTVGNVRIVLTERPWQARNCCTLELAAIKGAIGVYQLGTAAVTDKLELKLTPESGTEFLSFG